MAAAALLPCRSVCQMGERCCEILGKEHIFESCDASHSLRKLQQGKKYLASVFFSGETTVILKQGTPLLEHSCDWGHFANVNSVVL